MGLKTRAYCEPRRTWSGWKPASHYYFSSTVGKHNFNSLFVGPLLIFDDSSFESILVLRRFYRTDFLSRSTIPDPYSSTYGPDAQAAQSHLATNLPASLEILPATCLNCGSCFSSLRVDCVFIITDSIDYLQDAHASDGSGEEEAVLANMRTLVRDRVTFSSGSSSEGDQALGCPI
ncbi:uncharacterized protein TrAFT101_010594 [Trichoderma asperellum]|nr:hypothetical protein TrAFT101_010594 [Trichoderma asperellum]